MNFNLQTNRFQQLGAAKQFQLQNSTRNLQRIQQLKFKRSQQFLSALPKIAPEQTETQQTNQETKNGYKALEKQSLKFGVEQSESEQWKDRFEGKERKGCDVLVQALEREKVDTVFAYPGGCSLEIHQALTRTNKIKNFLCRHEQGEVFAAEGFAKATGQVGVCISTSGPGATNLVTGLADAMLDSVPIVAITGQVPRKMIGTDAFQETPIVEVTRSITKHNYLVMNVRDIPRIVKEAFYLARTGRPGPVLIDVPKDVQQEMNIPDWSQPMKLTRYQQKLPTYASRNELSRVMEALEKAEKPVLYVGGGCLDAYQEVREFARKTDIPVVQTLMGLGSYPTQDEQSLGMLGMHGTVYANYAVDSSDLLIALGVRFDDRVTGKLEAFASRAQIIHVDIDPAEISKNKDAHIPICADVKMALKQINYQLETYEQQLKGKFNQWKQHLEEYKANTIITPQQRDLLISPQYAVKLLAEEAGDDAIFSTGVGQHQMWAAQYLNHHSPRRWLTSGGLGSMGFGYPAALGAAAAFNGDSNYHNRPLKTIIDIDGDGSFLMNIQELATAKIENLNCKAVILNNQHLGMVVQWEDRFYKANRAHTYLGLNESSYHETSLDKDIYPDYTMIAAGFGVPAKRVIDPKELRSAIRTMLDTPGPYLLDIMVPHIEHVLPMIPGGATFKDTIKEGDGAQKY